ncbi:MAG: hypothetical protein ACR2JB_18715 [Bryobacteraceae bacterium]
MTIRGGEIDSGDGGARTGIQIRELTDQITRLVDPGLGFGGAGFGAAP